MLARLYRLLLGAYPRAFRARFGDEMTIAFLGGFRRANARGVGRGAAFLISRLADAAASGLAERWAQRSLEKGWQVMWSRLALDIRSALRLMRRQPGFAAVVVLTLALGIGANSAVFSLIDGMLLRPLPYREPGQLAFLWTKLEWIGVPRAWISGGHIALLQKETTLIESFVGLRATETQLTGVGDPAQVRLGVTTTNLLDALGTPPLIGRGFQPGEDREGTANVVILSHPLWQQRFGGDPGVLGRRISLDGQTVEVIGVMPPEFRFMVPTSLGGPVVADLWAPGTWDFPSMPTSPFMFALMARVKPGVSIDRARAEIDAIGARLDREVYQNRGFGWHVNGLVEDLTAQVRPALLILAGAAALVLLIACANVASLFLVRAVDRERELALRTALGAGRSRLAAQLFVEALTIAIVGAGMAVVLAAGAVDALKASITTPIPRLDQVAVDWRVLAATTGMTVLVAIVFAMLPVLQLGRPKLAGALKEGARSSAGVRTQRLRAAFVVGEIAMALMLLVGAVLLIRTFAAMRGADPGFDETGVVAARVTLPASRYSEGSAAPDFIAQAIERLRAVPHVRAAGAANAAPLSQRANQFNAQPTSPADAPRLLIDGIVVTPGYFRAAGITLLHGRDFHAADRAGAPRVAVIDDVFARAAWRGTDPIGQTMRVDRVQEPVMVVGIVRQAHLYQMHEPSRGQVYVPHAQTPALGMTLVLRSAGDPAALAPAIRRAVADLDPLQPVAEIKPLPQVVDERLADRRLGMTLLAVFASVAMVLAAVGIYGLMAYAVTQRTSEIGIRLALGAPAGAIRRAVLARSGLLAGCGVLIGGAGAYAASGWLSAQLYGVSATDAATFAAVGIGLLVVALLASYLPARRATRIDPARALR